MQVWDQVAVAKEGDPHDAHAGLVVRVDDEAQIAAVKIDGDDTTTNFAYGELKFLGR